MKELGYHNLSGLLTEFKIIIAITSMNVSLKSNPPILYTKSSLFFAL